MIPKKMVYLRAPAHDTGYRSKREMCSAKVDADGELEDWANVRDKGEKERRVQDIYLGYQIWIAKEQCLDRCAVSLDGMSKFGSCSL